MPPIYSPLLRLGVIPRVIRKEIHWEVDDSVPRYYNWAALSSSWTSELMEQPGPGVETWIKISPCRGMRQRCLS